MADTVPSLHLWPGGRGGGETVKVIVEQALPLGLGLLADPALDGLCRSTRIRRRLAGSGGNPGIGCPDGIADAEAEA